MDFKTLRLFSRSITGLLPLFLGKDFVHLHSPFKIRSIHFKILLLAIIAGFGSLVGSAQITQRGTATSSTSSSTTLVINKPAGVVQGDVMIVNIAVSGSSTNPTSSGWTFLAGGKISNNTGRYGGVLYKVAGASEPSSYSFTLGTGSASSIGGIVAFYNVDCSTPLDVTGTFNAPNTASTSGTTNSITTVTAGAAVIMLSQAVATSPTWSAWSTATSPGALSEIMDQNNGSNVSIGMAWANKAAAGSTGSGSVTASASSGYGALLIALKPKAPPVITSQSTAAQNKCIGQAFSPISVTATGASLTYQWYSNTSAVNTGGSSILNATTSSYTPSSTTAGTLYYYCVVSNGCSSVISAVSGSFVVSASPTATISYANSSVCNSVTNPQSVTLTGNTGGTFSASPSGLSINSTTGEILPSASIAGNFTITYTIAASGGCSAYTTTTTITIVNDPNTISYPLISYCSNFTGTVSVTRNAPSGGTYSSSPSGLSIDAVTGTVSISSSTPGVYTIYYTFTGAACSNVINTSLTVKSAPVVNCPANTGTCLNAPAFALSGATPLGGTYSGVGVSGGTFNPATAGLGTQSINYVYTSSNGCSSSCSFNMTVTNSTISVNAQPLSTYVYSGNTATINLSSTVSGTQYTWTATSNNSSVSGFSNQTTPVTGPISQLLSNGSTLVGEVTYTITPQLIGCSGLPVTVVISLPSTTFCQSPGTFQAGSCIIDMGVVPQTYANGLKPYGLVYQLLNTYKVPVYWAVNADKSFVTTTPKVDQTDFTVDGRAFRGGSFIIPAGYLSQVQSVINSWVAQGVVVYYSATSFSPPVYDLLTRVPKVVLDAATGALVESGFYTKAGIPNTAYTKGGIPSAITNCDDIYVLPHAEPQNWTQAQKDSLKNFINNRGWFFSSCYAVSFIENMPGMNFLSNNGLVAYNNHGNPTIPYNYSLGAGADANNIASDPFMQFVGALDGAINNDQAYEKIYLPNSLGWRPSTKIAIYKSNFVNTNTNITYPANAAILAYGRAFGDNTKGMIMYLSGHDFESGTNEAENVAKARVYASFLLRSGCGTRPLINPVSIPASALSGETITLSVTVPSSTSPIVTTEWSSDLNGIFTSQSATTNFTAPTVDVPTVCTVQFKVTDACGRVGLYCTTILINPTITNNYIGSSQNICSGTQPASLTGSLPRTQSGSNFTYLWLMSTTSASSGFTAAAGVNNQQNYTPQPLTQSTWFRRQVTLNNMVVFSTSIKITVLAAPSFSTQPSATSQTVCQGGLFTGLSVASTDSITAYQWYGNSSASTSGGTIISAGGNSNAYTPSSSVQGVSYYYCQITSLSGCTALSTVSGSFTVSSALTVTQQPSLTTVTACQGAPMTPLTVSGNGGGLSYQWYSNPTTNLTSGAGWVIVTGATSASFTPTAVGSFYYYCRIGAPNSGCSPALVKSNASGLITINPSPVAVITNNTGTSVITCETRVIGLTASGGSAYTWNASLGNNAIVSVNSPGTYTVTVTNNGCSNTADISITSSISGSKWTGEVDADWNHAGNWCGGIPTDTSVVEIPAGMPNDPVITGNIPGKVKDISIASGAYLFIDGQKLQVYGTIVSNGNINAVNGAIEMSGSTSQQTISGSMFSAKKIKDLILSNANGLSLAGTLDTLKITGALDFRNSNIAFQTNDNLVIASDISGTGRIADLTANGMYTGNRIIGNVTVERYIPNHSKAWQFLSVPTVGQTIKSAWQEGNLPLSATNNPGYGTIITSPFGGSTAGAQALGFDIYTPSGSTMKTYDPSTESWIGVSSTANLIDNVKGYMIFVRGDRSVTAYNQAATSTTMRTKGILYQPVLNPPPVISVMADKYESIGNPYASAIDVSRISRSGGVQDIYYVWDPKLTSGANSVWGLGGYQTIYKVGSTYTVIPGGGSYSNGNINIESGQAFLVRAVGTSGTVTVNENCKTAGSNTVTRNLIPYNNIAAKLFARTANDTILLDGTLSLYDSSFNNEIDFVDGIKMQNNGAEWIAIDKGTKKLVAEQRSGILPTDTLFYHISGLKRQPYMLQLNLNLLNYQGTCRLEDRFLHTEQVLDPININNYSFSVNIDPLSSSSDRFMIVFEQATVLPVHFTYTKAARIDKKAVIVKWGVDNESSISHYDIEKSVDGKNFTAISQQSAIGSGIGLADYNITDTGAANTILYYRVKAFQAGGGVLYSSIVKVGSVDSKPLFSVHPNPVVNKTAVLYFDNIYTGRVIVKVTDAAGKVALVKKIDINSISSSVEIGLGKNLSAGTYFFTVYEGEKQYYQQRIIVQ